MATLRPHRIAAASAGVLAALVVLGACAGGGSSSSPTTTGAGAEESASTASVPTTEPVDPARAAFIGLANPICVDRNEKIRATAQGVTVPDVAAALAKRARFSTEASTEIEALDAPAGDEATIGGLLVAMAEINELTADLAEAVLRQDAATGRSASVQLEEQLAVLNERLVAYGLVDCVLEPPN